MKAGRLLIVISCCAVGALCFGSALGASDDTQELLVTSFDSTPGAVTDLEIDLYVPATATAPGNITVDVPKGYQLNVPLGAGNDLGDTGATIVVGGAEKDLTGTLKTGDPAQYASDPQAQACAPGQHASVWVGSYDDAGQTLTVPIFVDPAPATDTADSFILQACFPPTDVAPAAGAVPPQRFDYLWADTTMLFTNPPVVSTPEWRAFFTGYSAGTGTLDPQSTVEARSKSPLPQRIQSVKISYAKKPKHFPKIVIAGRLMAAGVPRGGVNVHIDAGPKPSFDSLKPWAVAVTDESGRFTVTKPLKKRLYAFMYVDAYFNLTCSATPTTAPGGCVREDTAPEYGPVLTLNPKR
jgi:hypothetical protein